MKLDTYHIINHIASITVDEYMQEYRDEDKFIAFCKQCDKYGTCWVCPPFDFNKEDYLSGYQRAYIIGTQIIPEKIGHSAYINPELIKQCGKQMLAETRQILDPRLLELEKQYPGSKAFFAGTCFQCPNGECTRNKKLPCIHPDKVRPSLEAFGFDIGRTASELLHIDLKWSSNGEFPEYFTLVSGLFTNYTIENVI